MSKKIQFYLPDYRTHDLLQGPKQMTAFRFPKKLVKSFDSKARKMGLQKTELLELAMISIVEKGTITK